MIRKNLTYILPVLALSLLIFANSVLKPAVKEAEQFNTASLPTFKSTMDRTSTNDFLAKSKLNSLRLSKQYQKRIAKSNLTEKLSALAEDRFSEEIYDQDETAATNEVPAKKSAKNAEKKKADEKTAKKEDEKQEEEEGKHASKDENDKDLAADTDEPVQPKKSESRKASTEVSSVSFSSFAPSNLAAEELTQDDDSEETLSGTDTVAGTNPSTPGVESFDVFSVSYFNNLLTTGKLQEFEQALKLALKSDLNSDTAKNAYTAAINFLFTKENEEFVTYDSFIRTQFLHHSFAVSLSTIFSNPTMSTEKIEYTAGLLNELVLSWDTNQEDNSLFSEIYQLAVLNAINADIANNEVLLTLQNSIATTSFYISNPGIEVSSN